MPLLAGKKNIGHNIEVEEEHGKPHKQALAIALRTAGVPKKGKDAAKEMIQLSEYKGWSIERNPHGLIVASKSDIAFPFIASSMEAAKQIIDRRELRATNDLQPVGKSDPKRAVALKRHEDGLTRSQDGSKDYVCIHCDEETSSRICPKCKNETYNQSALSGVYDMKKSKDVRPVGDQEQGGLTIRGIKFTAEEVKKYPRKVLEESAKTGREPWSIHGKDAEVDAMGIKPGKKFTYKGETYTAKYIASSKERGPNGGRVSTVTTKEGSVLKLEPTDHVTVSDTELPTAIKTSNLVPMPSGEGNEVSYATRRAKDRGKFSKVGDESEAELRIHYKELEKQLAARRAAGKPTRMTESAMRIAAAKLSGGHKVTDRSRAADTSVKLPLQISGSEPADHLIRAYLYEVQGDRARALDSYRAAASGYRKANDRVNEAKARDGIEACQAKFATQYDHPGYGRTKVCDSADAALRTAVERTRAGEDVVIVGKTVKPGRARAVDASPMPTKWQDGPKHEPHAFVPDRPGSNQCKVCAFSKGKPGMHTGKATDGAVSYKIEKSGDEFTVKLDGPGVHSGFSGFNSRKEAEEFVRDHKREANASDEHEGFEKLEHSLAHKKGVNDPDAVAASIGREKYGKEGMAKKAAAGRAKDSKEVLPV